MSRLFWVNDEQWSKIEPLLPHYGSPPRVDVRRILSGIVHVLRRGCRWCGCPAEYGPCTTVYNRFNRWAKAGVWVRVFEALSASSPGSMHLIDSSIIRAHQHAAGGKKGARITPSAVLVED